MWLPQSVNITGTDEPQRLVGTFATGSFFDVLGLKAERGRLFTERGERAGHRHTSRRHHPQHMAAAVQRGSDRDRRDDDRSTACR